MERNKLLLLAAIIPSFILFLYLISPLLDGIIMGIALAYVAKPIHEKLRLKIGDFLSALLSTVIIAVPIFFFFFYGVFQGISQLVYIMGNYNVVDFLNNVIRNIGGTSKVLASVINQIIRFVNTKIGDLAVKITTKFIFFLMNFIISIIVCFYIVLDGKRIVGKIMDAISKDEIKGFFEELDKTFTGLWFGNFIAALLIGLASIPYFIAFGIPYASLLSGLMFLAALIPVFAEWMIILPIAIYLFFINSIKAFWFMAIGAVFFYIIPELILRPHFVGYTSKIHPLLLMLSFIGGGIVAGVSGFFFTPMLAATLSAIYNYFTKKEKIIHE